MKHHTLFILLFALSLYSYGQSNTELIPTYSPKGSISLRTNIRSLADAYAECGLGI
ncbi:MAG: hypothetical protein QM751_10435 [Paludibacteraceae bacterium]